MENDRYERLGEIGIWFMDVEDDEVGDKTIAAFEAEGFVWTGSVAKANADIYAARKAAKPEHDARIAASLKQLREEGN